MNAFIRIYVRKYRYVKKKVPYTYEQLLKDYEKLVISVNNFRIIRRAAKPTFPADESIKAIAFEVQSIQETVNIMLDHLKNKKVLVFEGQKELNEMLKGSPEAKMLAKENKEKVRNKMAKMLNSNAGLFDMDKMLSKNVNRKVAIINEDMDEDEEEDFVVEKESRKTSKKLSGSNQAE